jgi:hypothetical protein
MKHGVYYFWPNLDEYSLSYAFIKFVADLRNLDFKLKKEIYFALGSLAYISCIPFKQVLGLLFNWVTDIAENPLSLWTI